MGSIEPRARQVILLGLADALLRQGSRNGETHLQKATYFLQTLARVPLDFEFIPYKHGPFSFALRDELAVLRADTLFEVTPTYYHVQAIQGPTERGLKLWQSSTERVTWTTSLEWTAQTVGNKGVAELERLSTALFVTMQRADSPVPKRDRALRLCEMKPHITEDEAHLAVDVIDELIIDARSQFAD
jgi:hypothetical protein